MAKSNKKYLSAIHDLITKISTAKSYSRKEVEFLHWRFTEYQDHYDEEDDSQEILEYFSMYIDIILKYSENEDDNDPKILKSNMTKYFNIIGDIASVSTIANGFVREKTSMVFDYLTDPSIKTTCAKELTRIYNQIIKCSDALIKAKLIDSHTIYLYKLSDILCACGDYEYQTYLVETIFRICSSDFIKNHAADFFPETESLQHALVKIDVEKFDETRRIFLNTVNRVNRNVYSFISNDVFLDEVKVTPPMISDQGHDFWIDFNMGTNTVGIYCDQVCLRNDPLTPDSQDSGDLGWELITFFAENVDLVKVKKPKTKRGQENMPMLFRFTLTTPFHVQYPASEWITASKHLKIVILDKEVIEELQSWVLPNMFNDRFKGYHSQKKYSKNANSSSMEMDFAKRTYKPLTYYHINRRVRSGSVISVSSKSMKSLEDELKVRKPKTPENSEISEKRVFLGVTSPDSTLLDTSVNSINILPETQYFSAEEDFDCVDVPDKKSMSKIDQKVTDEEEVRDQQRLIYQSKPLCGPEPDKTSVDESKGRVMIEKVKTCVSLIRSGLSVKMNSLNLMSPILEISEVSRSEQNSYAGRNVDCEVASIVDLTNDESEYISPDIISTQTSTTHAVKLRNEPKLQTQPESSKPLIADFNVNDDDYQTLCNDLLNDIEKDLDDQGRQYQNQTVEVSTEKDEAIGENQDFVAVENLLSAPEEFESRAKNKKKTQEQAITAKEEIASQMAQNTDLPKIMNSEISELIAPRSSKIKSPRLSELIAQEEHEDKIIKKRSSRNSEHISSQTDEENQIVVPQNLTAKPAAKEPASKVNIGESEASSVIRLLTPSATVIDLTNLKGSTASHTQTTSEGGLGKCNAKLINQKSFNNRTDVSNNLEMEENEGSLTSDGDSTWFDDNLMNSPSNMDCNTDMNDVPMDNDELKENVETADVNRENDLEEARISKNTPSEHKSVVKEALVDNEKEIHLDVIDLMSDTDDEMDGRSGGSSCGPNEVSDYDSGTSSAIICGAGNQKVKQVVKLRNQIKSQNVFGDSNDDKNLTNMNKTELNNSYEDTVGGIKSKCNEEKSVAEDIVDIHVTQNTQNKLNSDKNQPNLKSDTLIGEKIFDEMFGNGPEQDENDQNFSNQVISSSAQGPSKKGSSQRRQKYDEITKKPEYELPAEGAETLSQLTRQDLSTETGENSVKKENDKILPNQGSVNQESNVIEGSQPYVTEQKKMLQNKNSKVLKEITDEMCKNEPISPRKRIEKKKIPGSQHDNAFITRSQLKEEISSQEKSVDGPDEKFILPSKRGVKRKSDKCDEEESIAEMIVEDNVSQNNQHELNGNKNRSNLKIDTVLADDDADDFILSQNRLFDEVFANGGAQDQNSIDQVISSCTQGPSKRGSSQSQQKDVEIKKKPEDELPTKRTVTQSQLRQKGLSRETTSENLLNKEKKEILLDQGNVNQESDLIEGSQPKLTEKKKILQHKKSKILKEKEDNMGEDEPTSSKKRIEKKKVLESKEDNASFIRSQGEKEFSSQEENDDGSDEEFVSLPKRGGKTKIVDTQGDNNTTPVGDRNLRSQKAKITNKEVEISVEDFVLTKTGGKKKKGVITQDEDEVKPAKQLVVPMTRGRKKKSVAMQEDKLEIQLVSKDKENIPANDNIPSEEDVIHKNDIPLQIYDVHTEVEISSSQKSKSGRGKRKLSQSDAKLYEKMSRTKRRVMYDPNDFTNLESDFANYTKEFQMSTLVQTDEQKTQKKGNLLGNTNKTKTIRKKSTGTVVTRSGNKTVQTAKKEKMSKMSEGINNKLPEHIDVDNIIIVEDLHETKMRKTEKTGNKNKKSKLLNYPNDDNLDENITTEEQGETLGKVTEVTTRKNKKRSSRKAPLTKKTDDTHNKSETGTRKKALDDFFTKFNRDIIFTEEDRKRRERFDLFFGDIANVSRDIERRKRKRKQARDSKLEPQSKKPAISDEVSHAPLINSKPKIKILDNVLLKPASPLHRTEIEFDTLAKEDSNQIESTDMDAEQRHVRFWKDLVKIQRDLTTLLIQSVPLGQEKTKVYQSLLEFNRSF